MSANGFGLCRITAKLSTEIRSSESLFESQKFGRLEVSPIVVVSSFTLAGNIYIYATPSSTRPIGGFTKPDVIYFSFNRSISNDLNILIINQPKPVSNISIIYFAKIK